MNKKQLAANLAKNTNISQVKAIDILNSIFSAEDGIIANELNGGGKVTIPGFGTFNTKNRDARTGTNPSTGNKINIPAKTYTTFKAGKNLRDRIED